MPSAETYRFIPAVDDGWAILSEPPGRRDLGLHDYWKHSLDRSRRRREMRRARVVERGSAKVGAAVAAIALGGVVATTAGADDAAAQTTTHNLDLGRGSTGPAVRALQERLGIPADGVFGPHTERAVKQFQRAHGIPAIGRVGPLTTAALGLHVSGGSTTTTGSGTRVTLSRGATRAMQRALGVSADGVIGRHTRAALRRYERAHGLPADGRPDTRVMQLLGIDPSASYHSTSTAPSSVNLSPDAVRALQQALGVTADGVFGPVSRAALRRYEAAHGFTADGQPDSAVLHALGIDPSASSGTTTATSAPPVGSGAQAAMQIALHYVGVPYASGGESPSGFDCSGLVQYAFAKAGISLPRTSYSQYGVGTAVSHSQIQAGDLVFFDTAGGGASHVGIATSATTFVSATTHGVMQSSIFDSYWGAHYVGARRV